MFNTDRIRATHTGSLPRPESLTRLMYDVADGKDRDDFRHIIHADPGAGMAAIDWPAVTAALAAGQMPNSNGEQKIKPSLQ